MAAGDVSNAIDTLREAVNVNRSSGGQGLGRVLNDLGNAYVMGSNTDNALACFKELIEVDPTDFAARRMLQNLSTATEHSSVELAAVSACISPIATECTKLRALGTAHACGLAVQLEHAVKCITELEIEIASVCQRGVSLGSAARCLCCGMFVLLRNICDQAWCGFVNELGLVKNSRGIYCAPTLTPAEFDAVMVKKCVPDEHHNVDIDDLCSVVKPWLRATILSEEMHSSSDATSSMATMRSELGCRIREVWLEGHSSAESLLMAEIDVLERHLLSVSLVASGVCLYNEVSCGG